MRIQLSFPPQTRVEFSQIRSFSRSADLDLCMITREGWSNRIDRPNPIVLFSLAVSNSRSLLSSAVSCAFGFSFSFCCLGFLCSSTMEKGKRFTHLKEKSRLRSKGGFFGCLSSSSLSLSSSCSSSGQNSRYICYDRFIPVRSAMDMNTAYSMLTNKEPRKYLEYLNGNPQLVPPSKLAYQKRLRESLFNNRTRILAFNNNNNHDAGSESSSTTTDSRSWASTNSVKEQHRRISQTAYRTLDAPDLLDDYYLNLLDWGSNNVLAIGIGDVVYLWDASDLSTVELMSVDESDGPVTSVSWSPDARHLAVGLNNSDVQLWDIDSGRLKRTLNGGGNQSRVGALSWNNHILTTGVMDGTITNHDVSVRSHIVQTYRGHQADVCGLKWAESGRQLASGGNDNLLHTWDVSMASSNTPPNQNQWLHRLQGHTAAVKAIAWCPFQNNLIASGGGHADGCIKFWNSQTGACLNSVDTGSQVSGLLWSKKERELLSSHGFEQNQLTLWRYPSMVKMAEFKGHTSRVLFMSQSPDGCTVASAAADETLRFWNVFGDPQAQKTATKSHATEIPFSSQLHRVKEGNYHLLFNYYDSSGIQRSWPEVIAVKRRVSNGVSQEES